MKEGHLALKAQLEYDSGAGLVVLVEDVAKTDGAEYAKVRTRLRSIPSSLAPQLAWLRTLQEMCAAIESAIHEALVELTSD